MTERQAAIAQLLQKSRLTADVGCDHGILSLYLLQSGLTERLVATDISYPSLQKTVELLHRHDLDSRADCVHCDGLPTGYQFDQILIAGMGGLEICKILKAYFASNPDAMPRLILQPMRDYMNVRKLLNVHGYEIVVDRMIFDKKFYLLLSARAGSQVLSERQLRFGAQIASYRDPAYQAWLDQNIVKIDRILAQLDKFDPKYNELTHFREECANLKGSVSC